MKIETLTPAHIDRIDPQEEQTRHLWPAWRDDLKAAYGQLPGWAFVGEGGAVMALVWLATFEGKPPLAAALIDRETTGAKMLPVTRAIKMGLAEFEQINAIIEKDWKQGRRWAAMLGFKPLEADFAEGFDIYARC